MANWDMNGTKGIRRRRGRSLRFRGDRWSGGSASILFGTVRASMASGRENAGAQRQNSYRAVVGSACSWGTVGLWLLCVLLVAPSSVSAHSVPELVSTPEAFNQQQVNVLCEVSDVVTRYGEKPYTTFTLSDDDTTKLPVFVWGTPTFKQGQLCRVKGTFVTEKVLGAYALKKGIEANAVEKTTLADGHLESVIFKKKKRLGVRGARGVYFPQ